MHVKPFRKSKQRFSFFPRQTEGGECWRLSEVKTEKTGVRAAGPRVCAARRPLAISHVKRRHSVESKIQATRERKHRRAKHFFFTLIRNFPCYIFTCHNRKANNGRASQRLQHNSRTSEFLTWPFPAMTRQKVRLLAANESSEVPPSHLSATSRLLSKHTHTRCSSGLCQAVAR